MRQGNNDVSFPALRAVYALTIGLCLLMAPALRAQRYPFFNRGIEHGLVQSQPIMLSQDSARYLWAATLGGVSRYDGRQFVSYTRTEGLPSNTTFTIYTDRSGQVWVGTDQGLARFDGQAFQTEYPAGTTGSNAVLGLEQDPAGRLYIRTNERLYERRSSGQYVPVRIGAATTDTVVSLNVDRAGNLWAGLYARGFYRLDEQGRWQLRIDLTGLPPQSAPRKLFFSQRGDTLLISSTGLYRYRRQRFEPYAAGSPYNLKLYDAEEDGDGALWLAAGGGTWRVHDGRARYFGRAEGFTDNLVYDIFRDAEGNIWWGTDGDGIYRYSHLPIQFYDAEAGLQDPSIMGICQRDDTYYIGTRMQGLFRLRDGVIRPLPTHKQLQRINSLHCDRRGRVWVGTYGHGLFYFDADEHPKSVTLSANGRPLTITDLLFGEDETIWVATQRGLFRGRPRESAPWLALNDNYINTLEAYGADSLLLGTPRGVFIVSRTDGRGRELHLPGYERPLIVCSAVMGDTYYLGTADFGLLIHDRRSKSVQAINRTDGLPSNFIYNLLVEAEHLWLGTGSGISRLPRLADGRIGTPYNYGADEGLAGLESNHAVALRDRQGARWFGFTKGLVRFGPEASHPGSGNHVAPLLNLEAVQLFFAPLRDSTYYERLHPGTGLPEGLCLPPRQNHLSFQFSGLYLRAPGQLRYHYRLRGLEETFLTTTATSVTYSSLPPGDYLFEAFATTQAGIASGNRILYPFTIQAPFHQHWLFRTAMALLAIGLLAGLQYGRHRVREQRRQQLEAVRIEAFNRLRRRTAEDFHDEMGNKLTRIAILSDILKTKLAPEACDTHHLLDQIKDNVGALHRGSKDIIWSLQPEHDDLQTVVEHVRDIGSELFSETPIDFRYQQTGTGLTVALPLDYSRHLQMIAKEIYNNILKHARATRVDLTFETGTQGHHRLTFRDNGQGFCLRGHQPGNGLRNLQNRATRLGARIDVETAPGHGTAIALHLPHPPTA